MALLLLWSGKAHAVRAVLLHTWLQGGVAPEGEHTMHHDTNEVCSCTGHLPRREPHLTCMRSHNQDRRLSGVLGISLCMTVVVLIGVPRQLSSPRCSRRQRRWRQGSRACRNPGNKGLPTAGCGTSCTTPAREPPHWEVHHDKGKSRVFVWAPTRAFIPLVSSVMHSHHDRTRWLPATKCTEEYEGQFLPSGARVQTRTRSTKSSTSTC